MKKKLYLKRKTEYLLRIKNDCCNTLISRQDGSVIQGVVVEPIYLQITALPVELGAGRILN